MKIERFEDIEGWKLARELTRRVYELARRPGFDRDFALRNQICAAAGSAMHNVAEGFDAESNTEFGRFLRYAKRSCTEVQSELYVALDENYITKNEFDEAYNLSERTRAAIHGFLRYLESYEQSKSAKKP